MKRIMILAALAAIMLPAGKAAAQDPEGALCYALPKTVINLEVEAVKETFHAGPYAKFAFAGSAALLIYVWQTPSPAPWVR